LGKGKPQRHFHYEDISRNRFTKQPTNRVAALVLKQKCGIL
jgi:hypothetical protein